MARSTTSRLGSGAMVANQQDAIEDTSVYWAGTTKATLQKLNQSPVFFADPELHELHLALLGAADSASLPSPEMNHPQSLIYQKLKQNIDKLFSTAVVVILFYMTLRKTADVSPWSVQTDQKSHSQCASSIRRLGGSAREKTGMTASREVMNGGLLNGVAVDAVT